MLRFILSRLVMALPTIALVAVTVFALIRFIPGDPAALMLGDMAQPDQIAAMRTELGLDKSMPQQFVIWAGNVLHGDFGKSIVNGEAVLPLVASRFLVSAEIVVVAVFLASLIAVPAGLIAAWRQNSLTDLALVGTATVLLSIPPFGWDYCCFFSSASSSAGCRSWATCRSAIMSSVACFISSCPS